MAKVGGPRVFFDIVGVFNATRLISDSKSQMAVIESIVLDSMDAVLQSFNGISSAVGNLVSEIVPLGMALQDATIEFEKFAGAGSEALQNSLIETGQTFGFTATEALSAGSRMAQLSALIGQSGVAAATELGQKFALISGMGTEEAMTRMINLQQQTNFMYGETEQSVFRMLSARQQEQTILTNTMGTLDQLNTIENRSASTMKQLTFVMNQFAAQAHQTGEEIRFMAAMSATLIEAGEEQGKAGRALRMIYARLGSNIQNNNDLLAQYGIQVKDLETGRLRPLSDIVEELSVKFKDLTELEQQNIAQVVAGNDHYVRFVKLIENANRMSELAEDALNNQAKAQEEVNRVTDAAVTDYRAAQAELEHYKAMIGEQLIPEMTKATQFQLKFVKAFYSFGDMGTGLLGMIIRLREYGRMLGGVFDMYMQMKSVNIAYQTHLSIQRAINGEEIVRTDYYRKQGLFSGVTASNAKQEALVLKELQIVKHAIMIREQQIAEVTERKKIAQQGVNFATQQTNNLLKEEQSLLNTLEAGERNRAMLVRDEAEVRAQTLNLTRGQALMELKMNQSQRAFLEEKVAQDMEEIMLLQQKIVKTEQLILANSKLTAKSLEAHERELAKHKANLILLDSTIFKRRKLLLEVQAAEILTESEAEADKRLNMIKRETIQLTEVLGFSQEMLNSATMEELLLLNQLAPVKQRELTLEQEKQAQTALRLIQERHVIMNGKQQKITQDALNMSMMRFSAVLSITSMALGVFTDDEDAMRASMILMGLAMLPTIVQMASMTTQTMGMTAATVGATQALHGFNMAAKIGIFAGVSLAVGLLAMGISKLLPKAKQGKEEFDSFNATLSTTRSIIDKLAGSQEDIEGFKVPENLRERYGISETINLYKIQGDEIEALKQKITETNALYQRQADILADGNPAKTRYQNMINANEALFSALTERETAYLKTSIVGEKGSSERLGSLAEEALAGTFGEIEIPSPKITFRGGVSNEGIEWGNLPKNWREDMEALNLETNDPNRSYGNLKVFGGIETWEQLINALKVGALQYDDLTKKQRDYLDTLDLLVDNSYNAWESFSKETEAVNELGAVFTQAEQKMRTFANAREELFFGGKSQYMTGEMMKQVVNKGVENLYSNVELMMTNNFYGLTMDNAIQRVSSEVVKQLVAQGVPLNSGGI